MASSRPWVGILVALHVLLAAGYAKVTPYRSAGVVLMQGGVQAADIGAPDERQHVNYISHLLRGEGLPVFRPDDPQLYETYQSHQPPLYYVLAAGYSRLLGLDDLALGRAGFLLRLLNAAIGAIGVLGAWQLARWGLRDESVALGAAAFAALLPMNVALSGAVSNDPLLICVCAWCLAVCARGLRDGWNWKLAVAVGLLAGLGALTKTTAVALLPAVVLAVFLGTGLRRAGPLVGVALVTALGLALPWWIRNQALYGDPFAMKAFSQAFTGSMQASTMVARLGGPWDYWVGAVGRGTLCSFVGVFGYWDVWMPLQVYTVFSWIALGLLGAFAWSLRGTGDAWRVHAVNGAFALLIGLLFVRFNMQYFQAQGRYLMPALGPIAVALALGARTLARAKPVMGAAAIGVALLTVNLYVLRVLPDEFAARLTR